MLLPGQESINGRVVASCCSCRAERILSLLGSFPNLDTNLDTTASTCLTQQGLTPQGLTPQGLTPQCPCQSCVNWEMNSSSFPRLLFVAPDNYPRTHDPNCPVEPPTGRCTTPNSLHPFPISGKGTGTGLAPIDIHFPNLIKASKFAFYHVMTPRAHYRWNKGTFTSYMNANGIPVKVSDPIYAAAAKCSRTTGKTQ